MELTKKKFQQEAHALLNQLDELVHLMPDKGLKCADSQKICLILKLSALEASINGVKDEDFLID